MTRMKSFASPITYLARVRHYLSKIIRRLTKVSLQRCSQVSCEFSMRCFPALAISSAWNGSTEWRNKFVTMPLRFELNSKRWLHLVWSVAFLLVKARHGEHRAVAKVWEAEPMTSLPACLTWGRYRISIRSRIFVLKRIWVESTFAIVVDRTRPACPPLATSSQNSMMSVAVRMHAPQSAAPKSWVSRLKYAAKMHPCELMYPTTRRAPQ